MSSAKRIGTGIMRSRKSFPEAAVLVLEVLKKERSLSVNALSKETKLNRRTVEKSLKLLMEIQPYFQEIKLGNIQSDWRKIIEVKERTGLFGLPENVQRLIIRTIYYPTPSQQEIALIHLLLNDAFCPEKALFLKQDEAIQKLIQQGQIVQTDNKLYLSDEGKIVAEGALAIYPELSEIKKQSTICQ
jgi:hypothetical protein